MFNCITYIAYFADCIPVDSDGVDTVVLGVSSQAGDGKRTKETADNTEKHSGNYRHEHDVWRCAAM